ncbi:MAG TPA: diaminopimelate epimerase [Acidothermaceae bacterium]|nr:diaminopimelate epimerase [Acidothermaceae bacterium]
MKQIAFVKGHGTRNDFVVLPDVDDELDLTPELVTALCDRRSGIGADGVLRVVRSPDNTWFMDYRNADGSISETCGNGLRVFARYLVDSGLTQPGRLSIATRAGVVQVEVGTHGDVTVDMGAPQVFDTSTAAIDGTKYEGLHVSMGNPHLVCIIDAPVQTLDLTSIPDVDDSVFPHGVNVEFVNLIDDAHAVMRVHERGVGETESCGSGACAVAAALAVRQNVTAGEWVLDVPGGQLRLAIDAHTGHVLLTGPAVLVAEGRWLLS